MNDHNKYQLKPCPYLMINEIQHYAWGSIGSSAFIPRFLGQPAITSQPFAELWMGAHPSAPSRLVVDDREISLAQMIHQYADFILGPETSRKFSGNLPFLLKILSAGQPLSIQAHPNKQQAIALHHADPQNYRDDNHKPEIAVAISDFRALAGFQSTKKIAEMLRSYPEIAACIGRSAVEHFVEIADQSDEQKRDGLRELFSTYLHKTASASQKLLAAIEKLATRLNKSSALSEQEKLFLQLQRTGNGPDAGLFCIFFFNYLKLYPGQAIFIPAGVPHAYLSGDIVECMANSDNVVRAGLTSKFQDKNTLLKILTFESGPMEIFSPDTDNFRTKYPAPVSEFSLEKMDLKNGREVDLNISSAVILLVMSGQLEIKSEKRTARFHSGQSILLPAAMRRATCIAAADTTFFIVTPAA